MKKVKGIVISILVAFVCILAMPFSVYADVYPAESFDTNSAIGFNVHHRVNSNPQGTQVVYDNDIEVVFNDWYVGGPITYTIRYKKLGASSYSTYSATFGINGTTVTLDTIQTTDAYIDPTTISFTKFTYSTTIYTYHDYLQDFPYESSNFIIETAGFGYPPVDIYNLGNYKFPIFQLKANDELTHKYLSGDVNNSNHSMTLIFWFNKNDIDLNDTFTIQNGTLDSYQQLNVWAYKGTTGTRLAKYVISADTSSTGYKNVYVYAKVDVLVMPIYAKRGSEMGFETQDFCDNFGLPYNGLDDQGQESITNLEDTMSDFTQASDDVISVENDIGSGFENSLEDIPTSFNFSNQFGASFISSAQWVRDQFNSMTVNNPFGSLITFSLILGVGLLLLGRKLL